MKGIRIFKNRFYITEAIPGLSGFQRWDERVYAVVSGRKASSCRSCVVAEWTPTSDEQYALENGRVPECQPVVHAEGVYEWLKANPFQVARPIGRAHDRLLARHYHLAKELGAV